MAVHNGYYGFTDNGRNKIYGDSGHAWIVALESDGKEQIVECTARTRSGHIMPGKQVLLPKHRDQLENLVILIEQTNVREERETLMRQFSVQLGKFLDEDPYYAKFNIN